MCTPTSVVHSNGTLPVPWLSVGQMCDFNSPAKIATVHWAYLDVGSSRITTGEGLGVGRVGGWRGRGLEVGGAWVEHSRCGGGGGGGGGGGANGGDAGGTSSNDSSSILPLVPFNSRICLPDSIPSLPCLLYTSPSPRDRHRSRMPSSA